MFDRPQKRCQSLSRFSLSIASQIRATMTKNSMLETLAYGALAVLGFSFWFWMAVPFASHRESYEWLGFVGSHWTLVDFLTSTASTYRPLSQGLMGAVYIWTGLGAFPSSTLVQGVVQVVVYAGYVIAWLAIYQKHPQRRSLALWAALAGLVFFAPYTMLFHPWGLFYFPAIGVIAWLTRSGENSVSPYISPAWQFAPSSFCFGTPLLAL